MFRTIRRKTWFDPDNESRVKAEAFMRRRPKNRPDGSADPGDNDGLSVFDSFHVELWACVHNELSCHGIATLHVGAIRDLGLSVVRDPEDPRKLLIPDMPLENPNDAGQEALLDAVAQSARIALRCKWKRPE